MTANIGTIDRLARAVLGVILLIWGATALAGGAQIAAIVAGVVLLATAALRFCGLYRLIGVSTCPR